jgi:deoxyribodipyrimidine photo-lyase
MPSLQNEPRVQLANDAPVRSDGDYVLYWMIAARRASWSHALDRAATWARTLNRPLLVLEALRVGYPYASDRLHRFILQGMAANAESFRDRAAYHPYVEPQEGAGRGLLQALAAHACVVVTDDFPTFFLPHMVAAAARKLPVRLEIVDSNGLWPMRATDRLFVTARSFRAFLAKNLGPHLQPPPADPLADVPRAAQVPADVLKRWPAADAALLRGDEDALARLPIDHAVPVVRDRDGGTPAARARLAAFLRDGLARYDEHNHPDADATSGLSPYLHFGHLSVHEVIDAIGRKTGWKPWRAPWSPPAAVAGFVDELVTWRELSYNFCALRDDASSWTSLPAWARATLDQHAGDPRPHHYTRDELEQARTGDEFWNAAQRELLREGRLHGYLRMLWGKKILEWSATPQDALATMLHLNDRWALDGRDPNSIAGIAWVLGRYDRPWGPVRPIFGTIRYMSSENTRRKLHLRAYLERYGPPDAPPPSASARPGTSGSGRGRATRTRRTR